ncbi:hypothetical protein ASG87_18450 [Frateuria sp. Soil773]|uniref:DUF3304 domain-containing protein n=1 Tax=Frateuria sp. Soil773 TaxID=1736407 RepID=UPI00070003E8|nr:DUF3304 domain-containing protein [Frateuria sp. Soil773]KRE92088.1 hypothetical protein ASG87_18450 [Frateuria sp. Soil773]
MSQSIAVHRAGPTLGIKGALRSVVWLVVVGMALLLSACGRPYDPSEHAQPAPDATIGVGLTGIDHLADYLSVQDFSVNGVDGAQAGKGGRTVCCMVIPLKWRPGLKAVVRWNVTNWRDCHGEDFERTVTVEPYAKPGQVWVHFLANGSVRVISSIVGPGNPAYPGPHDAIPPKEPWYAYPIETTCKQHDDKVRAKERQP